MSDILRTRLQATQGKKILGQTCLHEPACRQQPAATSNQQQPGTWTGARNQEPEQQAIKNTSASSNSGLFSSQGQDKPPKTQAALFCFLSAALPKTSTAILLFSLLLAFRLPLISSCLFYSPSSTLYYPTFCSQSHSATLHARYCMLTVDCFLFFSLYPLHQRQSWALMHI